MPRHATPELFPKIKITFINSPVPDSFSYMISAMRITGTDLASRFVQDDVNPDYIVASNSVMTLSSDLQRLKNYLTKRKDAVFIFFNGECFEPDMNVFDYATTWNLDFTCGDRIIHNVMFNLSENNDIQGKIITNTLTLPQAREILSSSPKFCNFLYSHACEARDSFFHLLSQYKRVDSLGKHLNNMPTQMTFTPDWFQVSIDAKSGYKFSIAMENATCKGYTTEKIISSLQAHTVPIYWGDPCVTRYINPKAFINCNDYDSFDEVVERVKEIDSNDDLWLDMVTQPWQTQEQHDRLVHDIEEYYAQLLRIFTQDIKSAKRVATGTNPDRMRRGFSGIVKPFYVRWFLKARSLIGNLFPKRTKAALKRFLRIG